MMTGAELGATYVNARYYVSNTNRFASADTLIPDPANPQQFNRYSYVLNSPLNFIDPTGHECWSLPNGNQICSQDPDYLLGTKQRLSQSDRAYLLNQEDSNPLPIKLADEPKSDFNIVVPWSKEIGDGVSAVTDIFGVIASAGKSFISGVGVSGYSLGPLGGAASSTIVDEIEDYGDWVTLALDIFGEVANGDTRLAMEKNDSIINYRGTLILGQDVSLDLVTMGLDRAIPSSEFDLACNLFDTGYGAVKLTGNMPNRLEIRISTYPPFIEIVVYDPSVVDE